MNLEFDKTFSKNLDKIGDNSISSKIELVISEIVTAKSLLQIKNIKKLVGYQNYYRIKLGNYRIGLELINKTTIRIITISHRKVIYKKFPK